MGPRKKTRYVCIIIAHGAYLTITSRIEIGIEKVVDFPGGHFACRHKRNLAPNRLLIFFLKSR